MRAKASAYLFACPVRRRADAQRQFRIGADLGRDFVDAKTGASREVQVVG